MRNVTNRILQMLAIIILATSCNINLNDTDDKTEIRINGKGELVEQEISVAEFSEINNIGVMDIHVTKGHETSVTLRAQQNIMEHITCKTTGKELQLGIEDNVKIGTSKGIYADIVMQNDVNNIKIIGTGNIKLAGEKQEELKINIIGTGNVDAYELEVDDCQITSTGTGSCKVYVNENLSVYITGLGKVYYKGKPKIQQTIVGLGGVIDSN